MFRVLAQMGLKKRTKNRKKRKKAYIVLTQIGFNTNNTPGRTKKFVT